MVETTNATSGCVTRVGVLGDTGPFSAQFDIIVSCKPRDEVG